MMIIVSVKEVALLLAVDEIVGGVEVEDQMFRGHRVRGEELIDQDLGDLDQGFAVEAVLQATESGRRGEWRLHLGRLSGGNLEHGVNAKCLMIVEIFLSQGDGGDPLCDHGALVVNDEGGASGIGDGGVECIEEADFLGDLAQQQGAGVGDETAALEVGDDGLGPEGGKVERFCVTVCHGNGLGH